MGRLGPSLDGAPGSAYSLVRALPHIYRFYVWFATRVAPLCARSSAARPQRARVKYTVI